MQTRTEDVQIPIEDQHHIDALVADLHDKPGGLLTILEKVQDRNRQKYLPMETLRYIAKKAGVPLSQIYSVATFYSFFNLTPQSDHTVCICRGTACHARGSRGLLNVTNLTPDKHFQVRLVACIGQCALAPVVEVDHRVYGHVNEREMRKIIDQVNSEAVKQ